MGAVDLVIQVESPKSVTRGLQRIGRAGHGMGEVSKGRIFPKYRGDLLECAVVARRMREGEIEETTIPQNPLDVLAQHLVSMAALDEWEVDEVERLVTATQSFHDLSREQLENVLDMLDGRYPSDRFAELRPRIVWDRTEGTIHGRKGARQLVVTNAGTIPDRGLYGVHLPDGRRVGELDEEMVYEARAGQTFLLGAEHLADRGNHPRPGDRHPGPRRPRRGPVLEAATGSAARPSSAGRSAPSPARRSTASRPSWPKEYDLDERAANNLVSLPARAAAGDPRRPLRRDDRGRALPRRDRRLAPLHPLPLRRPRPLRLGPGAGGEDPRRARPRGRRDLVRRRDRHPPPRRRRAAARRPGPDRPRRARGPDRRRALRLGPVRRPLPRERLALAADPARLPGQAHAALAAAAEVAEPARSGAGLPPLPGHPRDLPRVPAGRARPARAARPAGKAALALAQPGRGGDADRLALRLLAALRLRRHLHVRGGHAERRAAGGGAGARPRPAARAARPGGAARADRPRGAGRSRRAAPAPHRGRPRRRPRRPPAAAAQPRRPDRGGVRRAASPRATRRPRCWRSWSPSGASPRSASPARSATSPPRTPASTATRSACPGRPACRRPSSRSTPTRCAPWSAATPAPTAPSRPRSSPQRYGVDPLPALRELESEGAMVRGELLPGGTEREWCDSEVLRRVRRASLARLRKEVEAADTPRARPLPAELAERRRLPPQPAPGSTACARRWCRCRAWR